MKVMVIPIVNGVLGTVPNNLLKWIKELKTGKQIGFILTSTFLRST